MREKQIHLNPTCIRVLTFLLNSIACTYWNFGLVTIMAIFSSWFNDFCVTTIIIFILLAMILFTLFSILQVLEKRRSCKPSLPQVWWWKYPKHAQQTAKKENHVAVVHNQNRNVGQIAVKENQEMLTNFGKVVLITYSMAFILPSDLWIHVRWQTTRGRHALTTRRSDER